MSLLIVLSLLGAVLGHSYGSYQPTYASWNNHTTSGSYPGYPSWNNRTTQAPYPTYRPTSAPWNNRNTQAPYPTYGPWSNRTTQTLWNNRTTNAPSKNRTTVVPRIKPAIQYNYRPKNEIHYHYSPPQQISYGSAFYPVYQGHPPAYVYEYRDSGSRFDNLLTGLALYNLGRNSYYHRYKYYKQYNSTWGEICKLGISKPNGEYQETRIDCNLISSFIWNTTSAVRNQQHVKNTTANGTGNSSVTVTSSTVEDALKVKGPSIAVTPGMTCYMIRTLGGKTVFQKHKDCELFQEYTRSSLHRNVAQCLMPFKTIVFNFLTILCFLK